MRAAALLLGLVLPGPAAACRLALVLALDVSASVDAAEYRLQSEGMARALVAPEVARLVLGPGGPVALAAMHWSGPHDQAVIADWTVIGGMADLSDLAARVAAAPRRPSFDGRTAIGAAMQAAADLLARGPRCAARTLDLAADGETNAGIDPRLVRDGPGLAGVTVNALAVGGNDLMDHGDFGSRPRPLTRHLETWVIRGPDAFVEEAADYADFERAMTRKLIRELGVVMLGAAGQNTTPVRRMKQP
ncbi:MAG: DUF1194 domain-containing protein [Paracoccaceae bacterium]|nr:MAG: DUF1194 domain-containing protein [Paracoccaceae bacterium]